MGVNKTVLKLLLADGRTTRTRPAYRGEYFDAALALGRSLIQLVRHPPSASASEARAVELEQQLVYLRCSEEVLSAELTYAEERASWWVGQHQEAKGEASQMQMALQGYKNRVASLGDELDQERMHVRELQAALRMHEHGREYQRRRLQELDPWEDGSSTTGWSTYLAELAGLEEGQQEQSKEEAATFLSTALDVHGRHSERCRLQGTAGSVCCREWMYSLALRHMKAESECSVL